MRLNKSHPIILFVVSVLVVEMLMPPALFAEVLLVFKEPELKVSSLGPDLDKLEARLKEDSVAVDLSTLPLLKPSAVGKNSFKEAKPTFKINDKKALLQTPKAVLNKANGRRIQLKYEPLKPSDSVNKARSLLEKNGLLRGKLINKLHDFFISTASADFEAPLIQDYPEISSYPVDFALKYSAGLQDEETGLFGTAGDFIQTYQTVDLAARFGLTNNDQFAAALQGLEHYEPKTTREKAVKVRYLRATNQNYDALVADLLSLKNSDGGYGFDPGHPSDLLTTIHVLRALNAVGYDADNTAVQALSYIASRVPASGALHFTSESNASYYLVNEVARVLKPYAGLSVGTDGNLINIDQKIAALVGFLEDQYDPATKRLNYSDDVIDLAMSLQTFELNDGLTADQRAALRDEVVRLQGIDGRFGDSYESTLEAARTLAQPDLVLTGMTAPANLINGTAATVTLSLKNAGYAPTKDIDLYLFADGVKLLELTNLDQQGLSLDPQETVNLNIALPNTKQFVGQTQLTFYIEAEGEARSDNNWRSQTLNFATASNGHSALPVYYTVRQYEWQGQPAILMDVAQKADANRAGYVLGWRAPGGSWSFGLFNPNNNVIFGGLPGLPFTEGSEIEITVGTVWNNNGSLSLNDYFNPGTRVTLTSNPVTQLGQVSGRTTVGAVGQSGLTVITGEVKSEKDGEYEIPNMRNGAAMFSVLDNAYQRLYTRAVIRPQLETPDVRIFTQLNPDNQAPQVTGLTVGNLVNGQLEYDQSVPLTVTVSDNLQVKAVDIYHYLPTQQLWSFVTTIAASGTQAVGEWNVPAQLGAGHKLRAVAWDYQGNTSAPFITPAFEIIPPAVGVVPGVSVEAAPGGVHIAWEEYVNGREDFSHFAVYRTEAANAQLAGLAPIITYQNLDRHFYHDLEVEVGRTYYYAVTAVHAGGVQNPAAQFVGSVTPQAPINNLVTDGVMEAAAVAPWRAWGSPTSWAKSVSDSYSGRRSIAVDSTTQHAGIQQLPLLVEAGHSYKYSFRYNLASGQLNTILGIKSSNADFEGRTTRLPPTDGQWESYERLFTVPDDFTSDFRVRLSIDHGTGFIDEVVLEEVGAPPIIRDGAMELEGGDYWSRWGSAGQWEKTTESVHAGSQSLRISGTGGGVYQSYIPVEAGLSYQFSFWYKVDSGLLNNILGIRSANLDFEGKTTRFGSTNGTWVRFQRDFTVPEDFVGPFIARFSIKNGTSYIDDVSIVEIPARLALSDGNMEGENLGPWRGYAGPGVLQKISDSVHGGLRSLYLETVRDTVVGHREDGGVQQLNLDLVPGQRYKLSFWYRLRGQVEPRIGNGTSNRDFEFNEFVDDHANWPILGSADVWTFYQRQFVAPNSDDLRLVFDVTDGEGIYDAQGVAVEYRDYDYAQFWLDDIRIDSL